MIARETLHDLVSYDPATGKFRWRERAGHWFADARYQDRWNDRYAGREAFTAMMTNGYRQAGLLGRKYLAHRVAYAYVTGEWPEFIDHINGDRADNRFDNLRPADRTINARNQKRFVNNTSGVTGVSRDRRNGNWRALVCGTEVGRFDTFAAAVAARETAATKLGFHKNHGRAV